MSAAYRVLIVDDDPAQAEMVSEFLRISGYQDVHHAGDLRTAWEHLDRGEFDILLLDYKLPDGTGLDMLDRMAQRSEPTPVVMITGQGNERIAVQAIQRGASEYLLKSGGYLVSLPALIHKTVQAHRLRLAVQRTQEQIRYQATLLNNVRDAIVVWDMTGRITYWNPAAGALFGWSAEERLGRPVTTSYFNTFNPPIVPPASHEATSPHVVRQCVNRNGRILWVSSQLTVLRDGEAPHPAIGYMDVSHDITRRVEAEQALRESEARYRVIVEDYQTELICRFRLNGALTFVNEVFCRYFGHSREELLGMNILYFIPEHERPRLVQHLGGFSPERPVFTLEHQVTLPGQGLRWLQRTDRAIFDDHERILEFQSMSRDITDRKHLEDQILAAQSQLLQAARLATIGEIASGVAHQIYNPLTTIIADAQILLRSLPQGSPGRDSAEAIEQAGWRMQSVVQRLLEFSRPATENFDAVSVNETLLRAVSLIRPSLESIGCALETRLAEGLPLVNANARQLESLWVNLLLLARDAVAAEEQRSLPALVTIESRLDTPDSVVVEVKDNGILIPNDQLGTIFEPNFVGPSSGRGAGMELSICREIVRQHGGQISAESQPEHDTILRVSLPAEG
jgi:PAS domain S-box-containing protein